MNRLVAIALFMSLVSLLAAQTVENAEPKHFYQRHIAKEREAFVFPFLRESDVVWEQMVWRTIDFREKFNHFFYYPTERRGVEGRRNFAYVVWDAVVAGEIPIYEDFETLLKTYTPKGEKPKKIYLKSGELSAFGEECVAKLKRDISKRFLLEGKDTADDEMPKQMDMVMLAIETIFGVDWDDADEDSIFRLIHKETNSHIKVRLKKMDKDEDDEDDDDEKEEE